MSGPIFTSDQIRKTIFVAFCVLVVGLGASVMMPFVLAILWALAFSVLTFPIYAKSRDRHRLNLGKPGLKGLIAKYGDSIAALKATMFTFVVVCLPFLLVGGLAIAQISPAMKEMQGSSGFSFTEKVDDAIHPITEKFGLHDFHLKDWWAENSTEVVESIKAPALNSAKKAGVGIFSLIVALLSMFFMLKDGSALKAPFVSLCGLSGTKAEEILDKVQKTIRAVFTGTFIVAVIQGTIMGITYAALGVPNSVLLGFVSIILCVVPMLGAPIIYLPVAVFFLAQGDTTKALVVLFVGFAIVSQIDNLLKPLFISNQVSLHPLAIFFFVLGGITVFGPIGLVVGPTILTILLGLFDYILALVNGGECETAAMAE
ncbi:MAG TPA: AI-2E family transporter [Fimbriimonas sp.]|nr:AI-2E family transporter [Fimbriimonas sp.]